MEKLQDVLQRIDGRGYGAYQDLRGRYFFPGMVLSLDRVQGDPFASPSQLRLGLDPGYASLEPQDRSPGIRRRAMEDFLTRSFARALRGRSRRSTGSGKSGLFDVVRCGQEILERTSCEVTPEGAVTLRFTLGLPAAGRRILGREAWNLLGVELPRLVETSLRRPALHGPTVKRHLEVAEDQEALRSQLRSRGLVAFLADGALLPRASGATDEPAVADVVPLRAPSSLAVELEAPHRGRVRGLGVRQGVTLIVGGGYHGKSTLVNALARSVYDHIPGDGRELCVTDQDAVVIRAEDGRSIVGTDIRTFIGRLPLGRTTERFCTTAASGSTSQAAAIIEACEAGARVLLIDEDTAATNFMIRDRRMRRLVPAGKEPIIPFIDRVRELAAAGVSTVLVVGGAGDYLDVADHVLCMDDYLPVDFTERAREVAREIPTRDTPLAGGSPFPWPTPRVPLSGSLNPRKGRRPERVKAVRTRDILFGEEEIDVSLIEQLVDPAQARAIGDALLFSAKGLVDGRRTLPQVLDELMTHIDDNGLGSLQVGGAGDRARMRRHELAAAFNRLRTLQVR